MTVEIISQSISIKVCDRAAIKLGTPGSAVRHASIARHVTDCLRSPEGRFVPAATFVPAIILVHAANVGLAGIFVPAANFVPATNFVLAAIFMLAGIFVLAANFVPAAIFC